MENNHALIINKDGVESYQKIYIQEEILISADIMMNRNDQLNARGVYRGQGFMMESF